MKDIISGWLTYLEAQEYAPNTLDLYGSVVRNFFRTAGEASPDMITADTVEKWMLEHKAWSPATRKWNYAAVRSFFAYCLNKKLIPEDPSVILPRPKMSKRVDESLTTKENRVYTTDQLLSLLNFKSVRFKSLEARDKAIIALMAGTGMRASEVAWLTVGQIRHREGNTIFALRKGQNIRKIVLAPFVINYLNDYLSQRNGEDDEPLFITREKHGIDRHTIYNMLATRQKELGLRTGTHNIRYTVINAVERSTSAGIARDIAGQKSIAVTNNYLVSSQDEREAAIASLPWADRM